MSASGYRADNHSHTLWYLPWRGISMRASLASVSLSGPLGSSSSQHMRTPDCFERPCFLSDHIRPPCTMYRGNRLKIILNRAYALGPGDYSLTHTTHEINSTPPRFDTELACFFFFLLFLCRRSRGHLILRERDHQRLSGNVLWGVDG